jgi:ABC-type uncharacterized transport system permease subunit
MRYLRGFGAFWYDFLVGDRPELFVGSILALVLVWLAIKAGLDPGVAGLSLTVVILGLGALSIGAATRSKRR